MKSAGFTVLKIEDFNLLLRQRSYSTFRALGMLHIEVEIETSGIFFDKIVFTRNIQNPAPLNAGGIKNTNPKPLLPISDPKYCLVFPGSLCIQANAWPSCLSLF